MDNKTNDCNTSLGSVLVKTIPFTAVVQQGKKTFIQFEFKMNLVVVKSSILISAHS